MDDLKKLGELKKISLEEIFGYCRYFTGPAFLFYIIIAAIALPADTASGMFADDIMLDTATSSADFNKTYLNNFPVVHVILSHKSTEFSILNDDRIKRALIHLPYIGISQ